MNPYRDTPPLRRWNVTLFASGYFRGCGAFQSLYLGGVVHAFDEQDAVEKFAAHSEVTNYVVDEVKELK